MKNELKREDLKNNFLKNIVVRFDYIGISEMELEELVSFVKPIFAKAGYNILREEYLTAMDFQLQDPEYIETEGLPAKEIRKKKAYVYINEPKGIQCKLSTNFACVEIQNQKYVAFMEYSNTLIEVIRCFREKIEFLNCIRFGIRKVNQCIIRDISSLNQYFSKHIFQIYGSESGRMPKLYESKDCFTEGNYNINLVRTVVSGEYKNQKAYQVVLDSDIYVMDSASIDELFEKQEKIVVMNERLFELYKESLTEQFLDGLGQEEYTDTNIIGVEKNE